MKFKFSGYGVHPTIYESYTDDLLYGMFRGGIWGTLDEHQRQQLLQETVNREAKAMGQKGACEVRFVDMPANEYGRQYGNVIELNRQNFVEDKRVHQANGYKFVTPFQYSNYQALETVLHENTHAWQNQVIDNTISHSDKQRVAEYRANNFTSSLVADHTADNKTVLRQGSHYLNGVTPNGYYLYYFQATERDAHRYGENRAREIMNQNLTTFGPDQTAEKYKEKIRIAGYQANLKVAQKAFNNENIERDINNTLLNHYYGMSRPVDPETAKIVDHEMSESYKQQHGINQKSNESEKTDTEKTRLSWNGEPHDAGKSERRLAESYREALKKGDADKAHRTKEILDRYEDNRQAARDVAQKAAPLQHELDDAVRDVSKELGFNYSPLREGKSTDSMLSKVADRQKADNVESLNDLYRHKIEMNSFKDTKDAAVGIEERLRDKGYNILDAEVKDNKKSGYKGLHLTVEKNGLGGEIQFTTKDHWELKEKSDAIYDDIRELVERDDRGEKLNLDEIDKIADKLDESRELWNKFDAKEFYEAANEFKAIGQEIQSQRGGSITSTMSDHETLLEGSTQSPSTSSSKDSLSRENRTILPSSNSTGRPSLSDNSAMSIPPESDTGIVSENEEIDKNDNAEETRSEDEKSFDNTIDDSVAEEAEKEVGAEKQALGEEETESEEEAETEEEAESEEEAEAEEKTESEEEAEAKEKTESEEEAETEEEAEEETELEKETEVEEETTEEEEQTDDLVETDSEGEAPAEETAEDEEQASDLIGEETADESETEETAEEEEQADDLVETDGQDEASSEETAEDEEQANDLIGEETADESESKETAEDEEQADDLVETDGENEAPAEETAEDEEQASDLIGGGSTDGSADESDSEENVEEEDEEQSYSY